MHKETVEMLWVRSRRDSKKQTFYVFLFLLALLFFTLNMYLILRIIAHHRNHGHLSGDAKLHLLSQHVSLTGLISSELDLIKTKSLANDRNIVNKTKNLLEMMMEEVRRNTANLNPMQPNERLSIKKMWPLPPVRRMVRNGERNGEFLSLNVPQRKRQKCHIPDLDPFHPDVLRFYVPGQQKKCPIKRYGKVLKGHFRLKLGSARKVDLYYIERVNDYQIRYSPVHTLVKDAGGPTAVDLDYPLTQDFIKVVITHNLNHATEEYHMYPLKRNQTKPIDQRKMREDASQDISKPNILMLMVDGVSGANARRQLKKTVKWLDNHPYSYRLKGHSVVGDGTTPQLCAMLTGHHEFQLPEARRGFKNSTHIDSWPFLFKEFQKKGYTTVYSEDEPWAATFNYRLHGFKEEPTHKYLRTFWLAINNLIWKTNTKSHSCPHEFIFKYINDLITEYEQERLFGLFVFSNVAHEAPNRVGLIDQDLKDFLHTFHTTKKSEDTILIIFGDHGSRISEFRSTMQGRLEERLPFFSITFPRLFHRRFPKEMKRFEENSRVLTSFLDIHATLKHLLTFPDASDANTSSGRGVSLFTNVASMNRSCNDAGIETHWCPCLDYLDVPRSDPIAKELAHRVIEHINNLTRTVSVGSKSCAVLHLGHIIGVSKHVPNKKVQRFKSTHRDSKCDACGVNYEESSKLNLKSAVFIVTFSALPSKGVFEATVDGDVTRDRSNSTRKYSLDKVRVKEVSRLNKYGDQPACVADRYPYLRKFCYCTKTDI